MPKAPPASLLLLLALAPLACGTGGRNGQGRGGAGGAAGSGGAPSTGTAGTGAAAGGGGTAGAVSQPPDPARDGSVQPDGRADAGAMDAPSSSDGSSDDSGTPVLNDTVLALMKRVADWQLPSAGASKDWIHGALWTGIMATYQVTRDAKYLDAVKTWAGAGWTLTGGAAARGDDQCAAQTYFDAYLLSPTPANLVMLNGAKPSFDALVANPPRGRVEWWWEDALFMVPPGFARLGAATGDKKYFQVLDALWWDTYAFLFNPRDGLMYRDDTHRTEYWGRGNGWVIAGTVRVLQYLPQDDARRADYVTLLTTMAAALKAVQGTDGMWRSSLLNPTQFPNPETSSTGFITYAMAWGINNGVLDRATYLPVVQKAWKGLAAVVGTDGHVGYVQGVGAGPAAATATSTAPFGVGAFLLAASEVARLPLQ